MKNGEFWYWGGYFYRDYEKASIDGFNLLNEEEELAKELSKSGREIISHGMGFSHDTVLLQEAPST